METWERGPVTVLFGDKNGKYPEGNSVVIRGRDTTLLVDPSLGVGRRGLGGPSLAPDLVALTHVHEDHVAGLHRFADAEVHAHAFDVDGIRSLDGLMRMYGYGSLEATMRQLVVDEFDFRARPAARAFTDGTVFDLGGVRVRAMHTPGHTRGHCVFVIEPGNMLILGDIDLSSFGPYYGDAWSDLEDFERSIATVRTLDADAWITFHHVGVLTERSAFEERLDRFAARVGAREASLLSFLTSPRSIDDMIAHRFLYPPHASLPFLDAVERRTVTQHLARLERSGRIRHEGGLYAATGH